MNLNSDIDIAWFDPIKNQKDYMKVSRILIKSQVLKNLERRKPIVK